MLGGVLSVERQRLRVFPLPEDWVEFQLLAVVKWKVLSKNCIKIIQKAALLPRQLLRKAAFLEKKKKLCLANEATTTGDNNKVCRQECLNLLHKKIALSRQTAVGDPGAGVGKTNNLNPRDEFTAAEEDLDLCPKLVFPRKFEGSVDSEPNVDTDDYDANDHEII